jgi:hypothetical protein
MVRFTHRLARARRPYFCHLLPTPAALFSGTLDDVEAATRITALQVCAGTLPLSRLEFTCARMNVFFLLDFTP